MTAPGECQAFVEKAFRWPYDTCLEWPYNGSFNKHNGNFVPKVRHCLKMVSVRHLLLERNGQYAPGPTNINVASTTCENQRCVNPKHLYWNTRAIVKQTQKKNKTLKYQTYKEDANPQAKLTKEKAIEIFNCKGRQREVAKLFGISQQNVSKIKSRKHWATK